MEKVRPWCGQPSDRGRLKNRTEPDRAAEYCDERVCVFVCLRSYLWNYTSDLHQIFCTAYPMAVARSLAA